MKIALIAAGAGGMYCGSCLRDYALARGLNALGHECLITPTYTPIRLDDPPGVGSSPNERPVAESTIYFGGISVFLRQKYRWLRNMPDWVSKLLSARWLLNRAAKSAVKTTAADLAALTLATLEGDRGPLESEIRRLCDHLARDIKPDVVLLTNVLLGGLIPRLRQTLKVPVFATLQGDDIFLEALPEEAKQQAIPRIRDLCGDLAGFIVTCRYYADFMAEYLGVPRGKMQVVYPGLDLRGFDSPAPPRPMPINGTAAPYVIGFFGRIAPEKGLHHLVAALTRVAGRADAPPWIFRCAGYLAPHQKAYLQEQRDAAAAGGWGDRFHYNGEPDLVGKISFLKGLDLFSMPTEYREPKGLSVLEALACGVPVIQPAHGSFPELIEETGGGLLVPPREPLALAHAITGLLNDPQRRLALGRSGQDAVRAKFTHHVMAEQIAAVLTAA